MARQPIDYLKPLHPVRSHEQERQRIVGCAQRHAQNGAMMISVIALEWRALYISEYRKAAKAIVGAA